MKMQKNWGRVGGGRAVGGGGGGGGKGLTEN